MSREGAEVNAAGSAGGERSLFSGTCPRRGVVGPAVARASRGQIIFSEEMDEALCQTIRQMWMNRLAGFRNLDLDRYLRDSTAATRYVTGGKTFSHNTLRRVGRLLFYLRRLAAAFGLTLTAEVLDARVRQHGDRCVTRCYLVLALAGRVVRQSRVTMSIVRDSSRWVWQEAIDERIPRPAWPYTLNHDSMTKNQGVGLDGQGD